MVEHTPQVWLDPGQFLFDDRPQRQRINAVVLVDG